MIRRSFHAWVRCGIRSVLRIALAQQYFDQGIRLAFAFNHAEARRAFRKAQRLDPACAMCYWGEGLVLGPNINAPMEPSAAAPAFAASRRAVALKSAGDGSRCIDENFTQDNVWDSRRPQRIWPTSTWGRCAAADPNTARFEAARVRRHSPHKYSRDGKIAATVTFRRSPRQGQRVSRPVGKPIPTADSSRPSNDPNSLAPRMPWSLGCGLNSTWTCCARAPGGALAG